MENATHMGSLVYQQSRQWDQTSGEEAMVPERTYGLRTSCSSGSSSSIIPIPEGQPSPRNLTASAEAK